MHPKKENPAGQGGAPSSDLPGGQINPHNKSHRALTQEEAWKLAVIVFGSQLPAPRHDICGTSADGIRYWRAVSR
jgi:hypothetical protein